MSDKTYNIIKYIAQIVLPALTTLYGVIGATLNIPYTQEVITIAIAVDTFLGTCLGISSANYNKKIK
jgi:small basic protein